MLYIASTKGRCRKFLVGLPIGHSECEELYCCNFYDIYGASMIFMVHYVRGKVRSDILNTIIPLYAVILKSVYTRDVHCALLSQGVVQGNVSLGPRGGILQFLKINLKCLFDHSQPFLIYYYI